MKISIIVPVYNAESVLHYCVESILNQSYKDFELILVDDGSIDKSGDICDRYASDNSNIVVKHIGNQGVSKARNNGIDLAKGDYICFIDSDDYVDKDFLKELVSKAEEGFDFVVTAYHWVKDYKQSAIKTVIYNKHELHSVVDKNNLMELSNFVLLSQPWNKMFKRDILIDNNIRMPEDISLGEDTVFVFRYLSCIINKSFCVINKPLYYYFSNNSDSLLNKYRKNLFDTNVRLNNYLANEVNKWNLSKNNNQLFFNSCYYRMENVLFNTFRKENALSNKEKIKYNSEVMKSDEFQYWVKKSTNSINPIYKIAYMIKSYYPIYLLQKIKG